MEEILKTKVFPQYCHIIKLYSNYLINSNGRDLDLARLHVACHYHQGHVFVSISL